MVGNHSCIPSQACASDASVRVQPPAHDEISTSGPEQDTVGCPKATQIEIAESWGSPGAPTLQTDRLNGLILQPTQVQG